MCLSRAVVLSDWPRINTYLKTKTAEEVLKEVLKESDSEDDQEANSDAGEGNGDENDDEESETAETSQGPMKFNGDLFDAEDSSDDNDLDRAAGADYDSAEDKDFDESTIDPKLLKKLKKMKGAAKKPREQKSRKCKPTTDDMLALHSESQRLIRETHVSLPYHKPAPKSLKDFLARAQKKQEAYKAFKKGRRTLDIEKAQIIQDKIAESSVEKLPRLRSKKRFHGSGKPCSGTDSQQSLQDSGIVSSGLEPHSQDADGGETSVKDNDRPLSLSTEARLLAEDELPDIVDSHSNFLCDSQNTLKGSEIDNHSQNMRDSACAVERTGSQDTSDGDDAIVEQFDSPPEESQSQDIEDVESLSVKEGDSQRSESVTDVVPESLESNNFCDEIADESETVTEEHVTDKSEHYDKTATEVISGEAKQTGGNDSGIENDFSKQLSSSSPVEATSQTRKNSADIDDAPSPVKEGDSEEGHLTLKAARQKALEELEQKGVVPSFGKGGGDFIDLDEEPMDKEEKKKQSNIDRLLERLMRHYPKKEQKKARNVEISIVEKTEEGQKGELKLKTVTYRTEGETNLDLSSISRVSGNRLQALKEKLEVEMKYNFNIWNRLQALKEKLEVGMRKRREAAYERRQQMYRIENEEGFEEKVEDGLPVEEEEAEMTDGSDTDVEEDDDDNDFDDEREEKKEWNNPFLDDEAEDDDDDDDEEDERPQRLVCAEINDMKDDDDDLFQDSDRLQLRLDLSDDDEDDDNDENKEDEGKNDDDDDEPPFRRSQVRSQRSTISDYDDDSSQLQSAQDPTKSCDPKIAGLYEYNRYRYPGGNLMKDVSFEMLTPMSRLMQDTQTSNLLPSTQPEESQDFFGSPSNRSQASSDDPPSQILDADGYFRVPSSQPKKMMKPSLMMENSQDAGDNMDMLMGLCSGQFAEGGGELASSSGGFEGLVDCSSQSDGPSLTGLLDADSTSQSDLLTKRFGRFPDAEHTDESLDLMGKGTLLHEPVNCSSPAFSSVTHQGKGLDSSPLPTHSLSTEKRRGVKRRLIVQDDSSDEEGDNPFRLLSDDEATKGSDKNELSASDDEDHNSDAEELVSFNGFKNKGKLLRQFVEDEAELSGSEAESDEDLDLDEDDDFMETEAGDQDAINENDLRDQVGRVHMKVNKRVYVFRKQMLDDDDRQLMRYKEMYLPDGDMYSEGGGRQRRFHWKDLGDEASQHDLFGNGSDEEKEEMEDPDEKKWRMERHEREKFLESQKEEDGEKGEDDGSQFMKFGQFFMKRQVSEPVQPVQKPMLSRPNLARSQSASDRSSPGKFLKPKIPKRGSFLARSKENLAKIAEMTKGSGLNVNGTRGSRSFVFSVKAADKRGDDNKEQFLNKAAAKPAPVKKVTPHKPPAKKKCLEPSPRPQSQKSIFKLLEK
ncbi:hypothetical protein ACOMHN_047422 [Nucella lapillus]